MLMTKRGTNKVSKREDVLGYFKHYWISGLILVLFHMLHALKRPTLCYAPCDLEVQIQEERT